MVSMYYRELKSRKVLETIQTLQLRVSDRFADSSLSRVCAELHTAAVESTEKIERISRPNYLLRIIVGVIIAGVLLGAVYSLSNLKLTDGQLTVADILTLSEAFLNDVILIGAAVFFLISIENRINRRLALNDLHELRSIAHVIDMHQLTKDPSRQPRRNTRYSPSDELTPFELTRYLEYCSEMLALTGKVAALYAQSTDDAVIIEAINEVEDLTTGLSQKVWQKIMIIDKYTSDAEEE
ncbi:MAG: hypothetical protein AAGN35_15665 [Bacteroidota bacterium]